MNDFHGLGAWVTLDAGTNTLRFFNNAAYAPDLDRVTLV